MSLSCFSFQPHASVVKEELMNMSESPAQGSDDIMSVLLQHEKRGQGGKGGGGGVAKEQSDSEDSDSDLKQMMREASQSESEFHFFIFLSRLFSEIKPKTCSYEYYYYV